MSIHHKNNKFIIIFWSTWLKFEATRQMDKHDWTYDYLYNHKHNTNCHFAFI